jgi:hypothetical protein
MYEVSTVFIDYNDHQLSVAALNMRYVGTVQEAVTGISLAYLPIKAANSWLVHVCDQAPHRLPNM